MELERTEGRHVVFEILGGIAVALQKARRIVDLPAIEADIFSVFRFEP